MRRSVLDKPPQGFAELQSQVSSFDASPRARRFKPIYQYPAMMVSPVQGVILDRILEKRGGAQWIFDPFLGSATTLIEAQARQLSVAGRDINPLSILLAHVESCEADSIEVEDALRQVVLDAAENLPSTKAPDIHWCNKWYRPDVAKSLQALRNAISQQEQVEIRRFFWAAIADVSRLCGNHRASRPKLQTRPAAQLDRKLDPIKQFYVHAGSSLKNMRTRLEENPRAQEIAIDLACGDIRETRVPWERADIVLTSPPYGDNHLTMPYGQSSYLPLQWIDLDDIGCEFDKTLLGSSQTLDTASLGGSLIVDEAKAEAAIGASKTLTRLQAPIAEKSEIAWKRTLSFYADFNEALSRIVASTALDAHFVFTLGNKTTASQSIPTTQITSELLEGLGVSTLGVLKRRIASKRLAPRNEYGQTIGSEFILIAQRG